MSEMKRSSLAAVLAVLVVVAVLASCSGGSSGSGDASTAGDTDTDTDGDGDTDTDTDGDGDTDTDTGPDSSPYEWHTFYGSEADGTDWGVSVTTDASENIYVAGCSSPWSGPDGEAPLHAHSGTGYNAFIAKFEPNGSYLWHTFYDLCMESDGADGSLFVDASANIYVTGGSESSWTGPSGEEPLHERSGYHDLVVLKLDPDGDYIWHTYYGPESFEFSNGNSLVVDGGGNIYVTGYSGGAWTGPSGEPPLHDHSGGIDLLVMRLAPDGEYVWHTFYGSGPDGSDEGNSVSVDGYGRIYLAGTSQFTWDGPIGEPPLHDHFGGSDGFILKLEPDGAYVWHTFCGTYGDDSISSLELNGGDNIFVTGESEHSWLGPENEPPLHAYTGDSDLFILKLDQDGTYAWHTFYGGSDVERTPYLDLDVSGNIYVIGDSWSSWNGPSGEPPLHVYSESNEIVVMKLDPDGGYLWHTFYGSAESDRVSSLVVDGSGNIFLTGNSDSSWDGPSGEPPLHAFTGEEDFFVLKLSE